MEIDRHLLRRDTDNREINPEIDTQLAPSLTDGKVKDDTASKKLDAKIIYVDPATWEGEIY